MNRVATKFVSKLFNFGQKNHHKTIILELLYDINTDLDLPKRVIACEETGRRAKTEQNAPNSVKCKLFFSITMAWCVSSYLKVIQLIRNIILILCVVYMKQYEEYVQIWSKTINGFCIRIVHLLTHRCLFLIAKNHNKK